MNTASYTPPGKDDFSLNSGERQVAGSYDGIRIDHRNRYEWADRHIPSGGFGLDVFCGNGYGATVLANGRYLLSIDGSEEAIQLACRAYSSPSVIFAHKLYPFELPEARFDFIVSLESIEHVEDSVGFFNLLASALKPGGVLVFSTPCEERLPFATSGNKFHYKHFRLQETLDLVSASGLDVVAWAGQDVYDMEIGERPTHYLPFHSMGLKNSALGQFTTVAATKSAG